MSREMPQKLSKIAMDNFEESISGDNSETKNPSYCHCGLRARLITSWTKRNPGRRFYGCPGYKLCRRMVRDLGFLIGVIQKYQNHSKEVINKLRDEVGRLKKIAQNLRRLEWLYRVIIVVLVGILVIVFGF